MNPLRLPDPIGAPDQRFMASFARAIEVWATRLIRSGADVLFPTLTDTVDIGSSQFQWRSIYLANGVDTTAGTSATINKSTGRFRVSAGTTTFTLTNDRIAAGDTVLCQPVQNDATGRVNAVVPGGGSCTVHLTGPTANMDCQFLVVKV